MLCYYGIQYAGDNVAHLEGDCAGYFAADYAGHRGIFCIIQSILHVIMHALIHNRPGHIAYHNNSLSFFL